MADSNIEWTDKVWNPVRGCSIVSPGCHSCYAMKTAHRFNGPGQPYEGLTKLANGKPVWTGEVRCIPEKLSEPLSWKKPQRVFVNSMSDLFHENVPGEFIQKVWLTMQRAHRERGHVFQVLTKRPQRMLEFLTEPPPNGIQWYAATGNVPCLEPGIWLGVSVEDQARADERIPHVLRTPAAVRFLSVEPMLGPVDLGLMDMFVDLDDGTQTPGIGWVIVGGESGPNARPCAVSWIRSIVEQCKASGVPCFVKQMGSKPYEDADDGTAVRSWGEASIQPNGDFVQIHLRDKKGGNIEEFPNDLMVREFPKKK